MGNDTSDIVYGKRCRDSGPWTQSTWSWLRAQKTKRKQNVKTLPSLAVYTNHVFSTFF